MKCHSCDRRLHPGNTSAQWADTCTTCAAQLRERQELKGEIESLKNDSEQWAKNYQELQAKYADAVAIAENLHAANQERMRLLDSWAELHADRNALRKWRDDVTSACGRVGGMRFDGVADEVRRLKSAYVSLSEAVWPGCRSAEDVDAASPSALVRDALLHREAYNRINDDARRVREDGFRNHTHAVAYDFVRYYSEGTEGCRNCGGFPHASTCFVGRFVGALMLDSINRQPIAPSCGPDDYCDDCRNYHKGRCDAHA